MVGGNLLHWPRVGTASPLPGVAVLLLLALCLPLTARAAPLQLSDVPSQSLGKHWVYHVDAAGQLDIDDVLAPSQAIDWQQSEAESPNFGLTSDPVWFDLRLHSPSVTRRLLAITYSPLDYLAIYLVRAGHIVTELHTGDQREFISRPIHHRDYVMPLELEANTEYRLLIRVQTEGALHLPAAVWKPDRFLESTQVSFALQLLFIGIMLALAIYNLLLCFAVRDQAYYWYVLYLVSFLLGQVALRGLGFQYLWPGQPGLNNVVLPLFLFLSLAAVGFFTHRFLDVRRYSRACSRLILGMGWVGVVLTGLSLVLPYSVSIALLVYAVSLGAVVAFSVGCYLWWKGQPLARLYVLAWSIYLFGNVLFNLGKAGVIPYTLFSEHIVQVGTVVQMLLLSFALAQRINLERQQRQEAQEHALKIQREANEKLESRVNERTQELHQAYEKLKELSELDGLTQLKNRQCFDEALEKEWRRNSRENRDLSLLLLDVDHFKAINDNLGHLCGDACLRYLAQTCKQQVHRAHDIVARYGGEEFVILLPCTTLSGAVIVAEKMRISIAQGDFQWEGKSVALTVSIGLASCIPHRQLDIDWLLRHADEALYTAKRAGRNCTMVYQASASGGEEMLSAYEFKSTK